MSGVVASIRRFWRAFRQGPGPGVRHHGHDLARTAKDAHTITRISSGGGNTSAVDRHVSKGASDYAKSFGKGE